MSSMTVMAVLSPRPSLTFASDPKRVLALAAALVLISCCRHYGWLLFPDEHQPMASKGLGGLALLASGWLAYWAFEHPKKARLLPALALWSWQEVQVAGCSFLYIASPWPVAPNQPICSALVGLDLGAASLIATAFLVRSLAVRLYR